MLIIGWFTQDKDLVTAYAGVAVGQLCCHFLVDGKFLVTQIQQDKVIAQAMHFVKGNSHYLAGNNFLLFVFFFIVFIFFFIGTCS